MFDVITMENEKKGKRVYVFYRKNLVYFTKSQFQK